MLNHAPPFPHCRDRLRRAVVLIATIQVAQLAPRSAWRVRDDRQWTGVQPCIAHLVPWIDVGHPEVRSAAFDVQRCDFRTHQCSSFCDPGETGDGALARIRNADSSCRSTSEPFAAQPYAQARHLSEQQSELTRTSAIERRMAFLAASALDRRDARKTAAESRSLRRGSDKLAVRPGNTWHIHMPQHERPGWMASVPMLWRYR